MSVIIIFMLGFYGLFIGEFVVIIWFLMRLLDLKNGKTSFKVSWKIPVFYLGYSLIIGYFIFILVDVQGAWGNDPLPMGDKLFNYLRVIVMANLTTPLFLWMAHLKDSAIARQVTLEASKDTAE